jgi:hypothetical protein
MVPTRELALQEAWRDDEWGMQVAIEGIPSDYFRVRERFTVEIRTLDGQVVDDDRGSGMELRLDDTQPDGKWVVRWVPGYHRNHQACDLQVQFVIRAVSTLVSRPFPVVCGTRPSVEKRELSPTSECE